MLRVFKDAGWKVARRFEDGVIQVEFPIAHTADTLAVMDARERWAEARSIERVLAPDSVAVIGASDRLGTVGHAVFTNLTTGGFAGPVHPVNLRGEPIAGRPSYPPRHRHRGHGRPRGHRRPRRPPCRASWPSARRRTSRASSS